MTVIQIIDRLNAFLKTHYGEGYLIEAYAEVRDTLAVRVVAPGERHVRYVLLGHGMDHTGDDLARIYFLNNTVNELLGDFDLAELEFVGMTMNYPAILAVLYHELPQREVEVDGIRPVPIVQDVSVCTVRALSMKFFSQIAETNKPIRIDEIMKAASVIGTVGVYVIVREDSGKLWKLEHTGYIEWLCSKRFYDDWVWGDSNWQSVRGEISNYPELFTH